MKDARNKLSDVENCGDEVLNCLERRFRALTRREEPQRLNQPSR